MSKQVKKESERTPRAKTASKGEQKRRGSRSRSATRKVDCTRGPECEHLRQPGGCLFNHPKEDVDRTKRYRACMYGMRCSYITELTDDCEYNHGDFQRSSVSAEHEGAKVEEVLDVETSCVVPKKTNTKSKNINRSDSSSAPAPAPAATPAAGSSSASAQSTAEIRKEFAKIEIQIDFLQSQMKFLQSQMEDLLSSRQALTNKINNLVD